MSKVWLEIGFAILVIVMLLLDLGVFNKKSHAVTNKEAAAWSAVWVSLAMIFSGVVYYTLGFEKFTQFQSAYWIEKALSVDNLFVFILVFGFFNVAKEVQHRILFWGVLGALVLRAIFIFTGVWLIELTYLNKLLSYIGVEGFKYNINILMTLFGIFLVFAGIKSAFAGEDDKEKDFSKSPGAKFVNKIFGGKVTKEFEGDKFFVSRSETYVDGYSVKTVVKRYATPLLVVLGVIEFTDLLFAVDSIPAIFAISDDPFILYTSNIFAILGLRSLYFLLANFIHMFRFLNYGLAIILTFIGLKMVISPVFHISSPLSLAVVGGVLVLSTGLSILFPEKE